MNASVYKQTLHRYELDRNRARNLYERRKAEVYARLPRIRELDERLTRLSLDTARGMLVGGAADIAAVKSQITGLTEEKRSLMAQAGYPEDYLKNVHTCPLCEDTGYIGARKCRCLRQRLIESYYDLSGLSEAMAAENFQSFDFKYYSNAADPDVGVSPAANIRTVYQHCVDFVLNFGTEFTNLLFYGDTGLGKTFLCNCIAKDMLDAGFCVLYVTAPRIFKKIEDFRFNRGEQDAPDTQLELIYDTDLLIIDDLGSEFSTVVTDTELFNIINSRLLDKRPTIISTNLSLKDFQNAYTDRIISRFAGNYKMLRLFGDDIRLKKKLSAYM